MRALPKPPEASRRLLAADDESVKLELFMVETDFIEMFKKLGSLDLVLSWSPPEGTLSLTCSMDEHSGMYCKYKF